jgi:hypothetical protein
LPVSAVQLMLEGRERVLFPGCACLRGVLC